MTKVEDLMIELDRLTGLARQNGVKFVRQKERAEELEKELSDARSELQAANEAVDSYRSAEKEGRCVVLPCKVGDTVYCTNTGRVKEAEVSGFGIGYGGTVWFTLDISKDIHWTIERFGKTVFLTRSEAEAALSGTKG